MVELLIVDMHTLWLIGGATALATAGALVFLRALHHPSTVALGLHALALALGGAGLLLAGFAPRRADAIQAVVADVMIAGSVMLACEAVRRLYGAAPRPALLIAFLFALVAGSLSYEMVRTEPAARIAYTSVLVAIASSLTAVRIARARDPSAEVVRRLLVAAGFANALVWLLRSGLAAGALGLPAPRTAMADPLDVVVASLTVLVPAIVTALVLIAMHARMADELRALATTDPLTRLVSRRVLFERGRPLIAAMRAAGRPLAAMMVDIDHFKRVNDRHGHAVGDAVLRHCARELRAGARDDSLVARYGGEEFCLLVPLDHAGDAFVAAERLRHRIGSRPCRVDDAIVAATISIGVAIHAPGQSLEQLLGEADRLLYAAKRAGRNRVGTSEAPAGQGDLALPVV
ncbi:MAG: GGDEF domain-containing protein [Burkholderiales bacterium]|nr:MAG: GGDEF domain-containing protein [Burkholderiales bacterium]